MGAFIRHYLLAAMLLLALFLAQRLLFLGFNLHNVPGVDPSEILQAHWRAWPMDISTLGYVMLLALLPGIPLLFTRAKAMRTTVLSILAAFIVASAVVNVVDIALFGAWGVKIDRKAMGYLRYPADVAGSLSAGRAGALLLVAFVESLLFIHLLLRIGFLSDYRQGGKPGRMVTAIVLPALCVVALRGGVQDDPINKSWSWFSDKPLLNLAATNSMWNLLEVAVEPAEFSSNPYAYYPAEKALGLFAQGRSGHGHFRPALSAVEHPNVVLVMLESWTADVIATLGGDSAVTPVFNQLCRTGLLFTNFYSTGFRTEQGLCALISGFPSQPTTTIIRKYGKFDRLPSLAKVLRRAGYIPSYYYGGDVSFANTRAYLESMGFTTIYDERSFPIKHRTRWGAFDEELFDFHLRDNTGTRTPFFHIIMTSTSHEPFDAPVDEGFSGNEGQQYRNTVHYTDRVLGAYLREAEKQDWYANTLIFIVADHGHYLPYNRAQYSAARHRIPFLVTGGALAGRWRGVQLPTYGSHVDFPNTLLSQLNLPVEGFDWGRDLLAADVPHNAFWTFNNGFGMADSSQQIAYDATGQRLIELRDSSRMGDAERLEELGKAQLQMLLDRYMAFDQ